MDPFADAATVGVDDPFKDVDTPTSRNGLQPHSIPRARDIIMISIASSKLIVTKTAIPMGYGNGTYPFSQVVLTDYFVIGYITCKGVSNTWMVIQRDTSGAIFLERRLQR
jgi:hypothetical protein